jgi:hypothetical protein
VLKIHILNYPRLIYLLLQSKLCLEFTPPRVGKSLSISFLNIGCVFTFPRALEVLVLSICLPSFYPKARMPSISIVEHFCTFKSPKPHADSWQKIRRQIRFLEKKCVQQTSVIQHLKWCQMNFTCFVLTHMGVGASRLQSFILTWAYGTGRRDYCPME